MFIEYVSRRVFLRVCEQLALRVPHANIAREAELSLTAIRLIASGRLLPSRIVVEPEDPLREQMLTATRCGGCGALVFSWPCLACQLTGRISFAKPVARTSKLRKPAARGRHKAG